MFTARANGTYIYLGGGGLGLIIVIVLVVLVLRRLWRFKTHSGKISSDIDEPSGGAIKALLNLAPPMA